VKRKYPTLFDEPNDGKAVGKSTSLVVVESPAQLLPLSVQQSPQAARTFFEFFASTLPNSNTRAAYGRDIRRFFEWCAGHGYDPLNVTPIHLAGYREVLARAVEPTTVKRHFSALRSLYAWWVEKGVLPSNPVREVKTEKVSRSEGKTPALDVEQVRHLLESFETGAETISVVRLRDRALIAVMAYSFARVQAVVSLKVRDYAPQGRRSVLRLAEKGGKQREVPVHHKLEEYLDAYVESAGIGGAKETPLFRAALGKTGVLSERPLDRRDAYEMIKRRLKDAGIRGNYSCHSFRATGITTFLENGGSLETAQWIAGHADSRTTKLYDRRNQRAALEDLERVRY
jgi:site-specific recombinase XerD